MDCTNQDVVGENCVHADAGEIKAWVDHYARLFNVEFKQPNFKGRHSPSGSATKSGKAAGPSGIIAEMLKTAAEEGVELAIPVTEAVFCCCVIPADREERFILMLYNGKGETIDVAIIGVSSSQIKSWSCLNRC